MATSPLYMASRHDLEDAFIAMHPCFQDKESEDNFKLRDQAISKLRRITAGNAPTELSDAYAIGIKALLEGIIKVINSLRTTVSKNGCDLIQEMAQAKISNIDNIAEFVLPHLMKLCASTKKIGADKANETTTILIANISYNIHLMKLILSACEDKNVQPRKFATGWLKTLIGKHREHKHVFEKGDGLAVFEKCLKKGLADSNPDVRQSMRPTYWAFIRLWPERSEAILSALSDPHRKVLISESAETATAPAPAKAATAAAAKSVAPKPKQSIKDAIAAKRQAAKAEKTSAPEPWSRRSSSASIKSDHAAVTQPKASTATSIKSDKIAVTQPKVSTSGPIKSDKTAVTQPKVSTSGPSNSRPAPLAAATRTLSSAPVRPSRLMRKPTATAKTQSTDFSKSAIEASKSASEMPKTPPPKFSKSAIEVSKSATEVPRTPPPKFSKSAIDMSKAATPESVKSPILTMVKERSQSPILTMLRERSQSPQTAFKRPLSSGSSGTLGLSPHREMASPPIMAMLRERSKSPASSEKSIRKASEAPTATSEDSIRKVSETPIATSEDSIRKVSETLTATSFHRPGNVPCSRKEGLARKALEELSVNEPTKRQPKHGEAASREKWMKVERYQLSLSSPEEEPHPRLSSVYPFRHEMLSHVKAIKSGSWRLITFRKIQWLIRGNWPLLGDDPVLFDELLFALFDLIDSWRNELIIVRPCGSDHNTQVLLTLRVMLHHHHDLFSFYYPRTLCALLSASRRQADTTHMRFALEDTVKTVVQACDAGNLEDSIDSVLDYLESYTELQHRQPEHLGLLALTELMKASDPERLCRPEEQASRLGKLSIRSMGSPYTELRQRAVEFSMAYASFLANDEDFWRQTSEVSNDRARLLTYYITKQRALEAFRVDEDLINHTYGNKAS
ncbi:MAG: hypothetical protein L6R42_000642 [Xanthoria sp. 1 TBL-2021]|nr:MAG: hypothetical protein L6R42_000642 [Xanthoria sp. 1 TBL-2021]